MNWRGLVKMLFRQTSIKQQWVFHRRYSPYRLPIMLLSALWPLTLTIENCIWPQNLNPATPVNFLPKWFSWSHLSGLRRHKNGQKKRIWNRSQDGGLPDVPLVGKPRFSDSWFPRTYDLDLTPDEGGEGCQWLFSGKLFSFLASHIISYHLISQIHISPRHWEEEDADDSFSGRRTFISILLTLSIIILIDVFVQFRFP